MGNFSEKIDELIANGHQDTDNLDDAQKIDLIRAYIAQGAIVSTLSKFFEDCLQQTWIIFTMQAHNVITFEQTMEKIYLLFFEYQKSNLNLNFELMLGRQRRAANG